MEQLTLMFAVLCAALMLALAAVTISASIIIAATEKRAKLAEVELEKCRKCELENRPTGSEY